MGRGNMREGRDSRSSGGGFGNRFKSDYSGGGSSGRFEMGPREMHKATCSDCGSECEVPFKPTEGKPVYCKACYMKHRPKRF